MHEEFYNTNPIPCVISSIMEDCQLMPHFVRHYARAGVHEFYFVVNSYGRSTLSEEVRAIAHSLNHVARLNVCEPICSAKTDMAREMDALRQRWVAPDGYFIIADLDELAEFPRPLSLLVQECIAGNHPFMRGELVDRLTRDGSIPLHVQADLWTQFPLEYRLSPHLHLARTRKCVLQRGDTPIGPGHHGPPRGPGDHRTPLKVHHFKWCGDLEGRLERRIVTEKAKGFSHWRESEAILKHLRANGGKLNLSVLKNLTS